MWWLYCNYSAVHKVWTLCIRKWKSSGRYWSFFDFSQICCSSKWFFFLFIFFLICTDDEMKHRKKRLLCSVCTWGPWNRNISPAKEGCVTRQRQFIGLASHSSSDAKSFVTHETSHTIQCPYTYTICCMLIVAGWSALLHATHQLLFTSCTNNSCVFVSSSVFSDRKVLQPVLRDVFLTLKNMPRQKHAHRGLKLIREPRTGKKTNMLPSTALPWEGYLCVMWCKCVQTVDSHEVPILLVMLPPALSQCKADNGGESICCQTCTPSYHLTICATLLWPPVLLLTRTKLISAAYKTFSLLQFISLCVCELKPAIYLFF